jgi:fructose-bisphosphate aldolase class II
MTAGVRETLFAKPEAFDPREYLKVGRANVKAVVAHKIKNVLGSEGKAL